MSDARTVKPGERQAIDLRSLRSASSSPYLEMFSLISVMSERVDITLHGAEADLALCLWATTEGMTLVKGDGFCRVSLRNGTTIEARHEKGKASVVEPRLTIDSDALWSPADQTEMP